MRDLRIIEAVDHVMGGYVVHVRWPLGGDVTGYGKVICLTLEDVFDLIKKADIDPIMKVKP